MLWHFIQGGNDHSKENESEMTAAKLKGGGDPQNMNTEKEGSRREMTSLVLNN